MRKPETRKAFIPGKPMARLAALCLATSLATVPAAMAGQVGLQYSADVAPAQVLNVSTDAQTVTLIAGLIGIERDLLLGQLFLQDGLVSAEGSHFTHPRHDNFPSIKDGLAQAGAPDLEPLLVALEEAKEKEAVNTAYLGVLAGLQEAKQTLQPSEQDVLAAVIQTAESAAAILDPSGTTDVVAYQECWGLLMVARGQLDTLVLSADPAVKQSATKMVVAFDDVILTAPDPNAKAPVAFDPAVVGNLITALKGGMEAI